MSISWHFETFIHWCTKEFINLFEAWQKKGSPPSLEPNAPNILEERCEGAEMRKETTQGREWMSKEKEGKISWL